MAERVEKIRLNDGNLIPIIGFGTYNVEDISSAVLLAIEEGYRHFDCADAYGNEEAIGSALKEAMDSGKVVREELYIVSKVWPTWFGSGRPTASARRSLRNLKLDFLDLLLIHWPTAFKQQDTELWPLDSRGRLLMDKEIDFLNVFKEFLEIQSKGITLSIGVSNFNSKQIQKITDFFPTLPTLPTVLQIESHPLLSNDKLIQWCLQRGITPVAYSPLARLGHNISQSPLDLPLIRQLATKYGVSPAAICIRWQTQRGVVVIPRSSSAERIRDNINVFHFTLTAEELTQILALNRDLRTARHDRHGCDQHPEWPFGCDQE